MPKPNKLKTHPKRTTKRSKLPKSEPKNLQMRCLEQRIDQKLEAITKSLEKSKDSGAVQKANLVVNTLRFIWEFVRTLMGNHP
jgi:hypothetical protein